MTSKRFDRVKKLYNSVITMDFIKQAEDDDDIEGLEEALMGGEAVEAPKKPETKKEPGSMEEALMGGEVVEKQKVRREPEEFVTPEELAQQLGVEEKIEKKEPVLPHRERMPTLFGEVETTKLSPGAFKAKVCRVCGSFNYPVWKKECARCKGEYRKMLQDVDYGGYSPRKAIMMAAQRSKGPKGKRYLGEDALKEIWEKEGHIELPLESTNIQEELVDRKGLTGVPNKLKLRAILENRLNVVRTPTKVYDPDTEKEYKTTEVYYDPEGNPVPIKYSDRDYFSLFEIAQRLQLTPTAVLKRISDYNAEKGLDPTKDPNAVKPAVYIDDLNQAYSWKAIQDIFKDRIKEVYDANVQTFLAKASKRWEYLKEKAEQLSLTRNVRKGDKQELLEEMGEHPQKQKMARLLSLRAKDQELKSKLSKIKEKIEKAESEGRKPDKNLVKALEQTEAEINESLVQRKPLEQQVGTDLTDFMNRMREVRKNYNRVVKAEKRIRESLQRLRKQISDYMEAFKDKVPETLQELAMSQTGRPYGETVGALNLNELASDLQKEKTSSLKISKLHMKLAEEDAGVEPLPGQLSFFPQFEEAEKERGVEQELHKKPTEEEEKKRKVKIKNIMQRTRVTEEEAEDRLEAAGHPLADPEGLTPEQMLQRKKLIRQIMQEHPTAEEAAARIEEIEARPFAISKPREMEKEPDVTTEISDRICPHCGEEGFLKGSPICQKCTFTAPEGVEQVVVETLTFPLIYDKDGNPIPKTDADGNVMIDARGNIMYKKRLQKRHVLVQVQIEDGRPVWATARKITPLAKDVGAKTETEREQYFRSDVAQKPRVKIPKPIAKTKDDFKPVVSLEQDESGELVKKPTGEMEHKQKCKGCPDPWVKVKPNQFDEYPPIEAAIDFLKGEELPRNTKAWKFEDVFAKETHEVIPGKPGPTILPTSSRLDQIVRLSLMD